MRLRMYCMTLVYFWPSECICVCVCVFPSMYLSNSFAITLSNIRYVSRVKWSNPGKGVAPFPTPQCSSYWKGSLLVALDYGCQLYLLTARLDSEFSFFQIGCFTRAKESCLNHWSFIQICGKNRRMFSSFTVCFWFLKKNFLYHIKN